jgi:hypothetical protein
MGLQSPIQLHYTTENKNTGVHTKSPYGSKVRDETWQWGIEVASCANKCKLKEISVFAKVSKFCWKTQVFHENILQKICHQNQQEVFFNLQNPILFSSHLWKFHKQVGIYQWMMNRSHYNIHRFIANYMLRDTWPTCFMSKNKLEMV